MIKIINIYFVLFVLVTLYSVNNWSLIKVDNTFFWWAFQILFFLFLLSTRKFYFNKSHKKKIWPVRVFLFWMVICIIRACFVADNYWEWKNLVNTSFVLLMGLFVFVFMNPGLNQFLLKKWFNFVLPLFFIFIFFVGGDAYGHYLAPIVLLSLVFPLLTKKWKIIVLFFTLFVIVMSQTARSNVIKFSSALLIGYFIYHFRLFFTIKVLNFIRLLFFISPITFLILAVSGVFNVFKVSDYTQDSYVVETNINGELKKESLLADTRTPLYLEVFSSAVKNDYVLLGRTPARGNDSLLFGSYLSKNLNTEKSERFSNEVAILNIFTWTGFVGVVLYFLIFFKASYLAIHKSNNFYIKSIGLFVAFRWMYAWVEDFTRFDLTSIVLWMLISMCFSIKYRNMTNDQFKTWVSGIFNKRQPNRLKLYK